MLAFRFDALRPNDLAAVRDIDQPERQRQTPAAAAHTKP